MSFLLFLNLLSLPAFPLPVQGSGPVRPTSLERVAGWRSLMDGDAWRGFGSERFPERGWTLADGVLSCTGAGGDLVTRDAFQDFELELEWRVEAGGNSGIKARVDEARGALGPEYQLLDDAAHPDAARPTRRAGALYDLVAPGAGAPGGTAGEWHTARIVLRGDRGEHWLDGRRVLEYDLASEAFAAARAASKFSSLERFPLADAGPLLLQDHGGSVAFRSIRVRDLADLPGRPVELFDGTSLDAWEELGDARYVPDDGSILGEVEGGSQSFLHTRRSFGDFLFEVDVRIEDQGNSGIQVRSHITPSGRVQGYQIEIDPSERAWSGGLYDEARRGWLQNLEENEAGREALDLDGWNRYRIECVGPSLKAWVNGVPTADWIDPLDLEGFLALQVHSGTNTRVRWANLRLRDLGIRRWIAVPVPAADAAGEQRLPGTFTDFALRLVLRPAGRLAFRGAEEVEGSEALGPPFSRRGPGSWSLELEDLRAEEDDGGARVVVVTRYGSRVSLHRDGLRLDGFEDTEASEGELVLVGAAAGLETVELLSEPELR